MVVASPRTLLNGLRVVLHFVEHLRINFNCLEYKTSNQSLREGTSGLVDTLAASGITTDTWVAASSGATHQHRKGCEGAYTFVSEAQKTRTVRFNPRQHSLVLLTKGATSSHPLV